MTPPAVQVVTDQEYRDRATGMANMLAARPERHDQGLYLNVEPENECGTTGCVAGWSTLALNGRVTIQVDGAMTWQPEQAVYDEDEDEDLADNAFEGGQEWLGLTRASAWVLFLGTSNDAAIRILRRLGDGRLSPDFTQADVRDLLGAE